MRFIVTILLFVTASAGVNAQFYYMDVLTTKQTNQLYKQLRNLDTRKISAISYEGDEMSEDFFLEQVISNDGKQITTRSASINNEVSFFFSNYVANRISHTVDSSKHATNTVDYIYDNGGRVLQINSSSKDFDGTYMLTENHSWTYNDNGLPLTMLKVKNATDTTFVTFDHDADGNVSEEKWQKKNQAIETYYYYYNAKKQLSDIVRYSAKAQKLLPDFMFEYDSEGHITQMTQTQGGIANYIVWKYTYNADGLKEKELVYTKKGELLGRIEYKYR